jgi:DMSO/TMAO reductase YedYZ molybdopterin-dependent catalytic subunit
VTKWSKLDTAWTGVSIDTLLAGVDTAAEHVLAFCDGGYTTNLPLEHGGSVRLLVPHLYFWKSAKWVRSLELRIADESGFWESYGYHNYGDPWREQRYAGVSALASGARFVRRWRVRRQPRGTCHTSLGFFPAGLYL